MWGLLAAVGVVAGLVALTSAERSDEPVLGPALQRARLAYLARKRRLTLPEAEDGLVLSRRLGERNLEARFAARVRALKARRSRT